MNLAAFAMAAAVAMPRAVRAECGDAVTDDRCDLGDRVSGRRPAESWGDYYARRQADAERQYRTVLDGVGHRTR